MGTKEGRRTVIDLVYESAAMRKELGLKGREDSVEEGDHPVFCVTLQCDRIGASYLRCRYDKKETQTRRK